MTLKPYDIVVIGGGIAGLTAGIYAGRSGLRTLIVEGDYNSSVDMPGGQLLLTPQIDNFPGFSGSGVELITAVKNQAEEYVEDILTENVSDLTLSDSQGHHSLVLEDGSLIESRAIVIATGSIARRLGTTGEDRLYGKGVSTCATCDGAFFNSQEVIVVGGGDTAVEDALYLSKIARKVFLVHRRDSLRTSSPESRKLLATENIEVLWNTRVEEIRGEEKVSSAILSTPEGLREQEINAVFVAIGHDPASTLAQGTVLELTGDKYLVTKDTLTTVPGVFVGGDVADPIYRQAVTAAGTGAMAAMNAIKYCQINNL